MLDVLRFLAVTVGSVDLWRLGGAKCVKPAVLFCAPSEMAISFYA